MPNNSQAQFSAEMARLLHWRATHPFPEGPNDPARVASAALVSLALLNRVAAHFKDAAIAKDLAQAVNAAAREFIDDFCGTPPHPHPWPHGLAAAVELAEFGGLLKDGPLSENVHGMASALAQASLVVPKTGSDPMPALVRQGK